MQAQQRRAGQKDKKSRKIVLGTKMDREKGNTWVGGGEVWAGGIGIVKKVAPKGDEGGYTECHKGCKGIQMYSTT